MYQNNLNEFWGPLLSFSTLAFNDFSTVPNILSENFMDGITVTLITLQRTFTILVLNLHFLYTVIIFLTKKATN